MSEQVCYHYEEDAKFESKYINHMHLLIIRVSVALTFIAINEDFLFPDLDFLAAPTA